MNGLRNFSVVYNPVAARYSESVLKHLISSFEGMGLALHRCEKSEYSGHVIPLIRELDPESDVIVTLGGDGTANEAVKAFNGMEGQHCLYAHISAGTTNDMAMNFGLSRKDPRRSIDILTSACREASMDSLIVNGEPCCYVSAFGYVAPIPYLTGNGLKKVLGHAAYVISALPIIARKPRMIPIRFESPDRSGEMETCLALVTSTRGVGGTTLYPDADMDDGKMDVFFLRDVNAAEVLKMFPKYLSNTVNLKDMTSLGEVFSTDRLRIEFTGERPEYDPDNDGNKSAFTIEESGGVLEYSMGKKIRMLLPDRT